MYKSQLTALGFRFSLVSLALVGVCGLLFSADIGPAPNGDTDGDSIPDDFDNCPAVANSDQQDTEGPASFDSERPIFLDARGARTVFAADVDGDGDIDVLSASIDDGVIAWYENEGGSFTSLNTITADLEGAADSPPVSSPCDSRPRAPTFREGAGS